MQPENIRLERFRKLKKEVRGSVRHLLVGIDVAKEKHNVFLGTATFDPHFKEQGFIVIP
jgi:hypothetical protein